MILNLNRWLFDKWIKNLRKKGWGVFRTVIVGTGHVAKLIADKIRKHPEIGYTFLGYVNGTPNGETELNKDDIVLGTVKDLEKLATQYDVDKIIIASPQLTHENILKIMLQSEKHILD